MQGRISRARALHVATGLVLIAAAASIDPLLGKPLEWGRLQTACLVLGVLVALVGLRLRPGPFARVSSRLCVSLLSLFALLGACELAFRASGHDFDRQAETWSEIPPLFQKPREPMGPALFRRKGPLVWEGQVLHTRLTQLDLEPTSYEDEPAVTVRYDEDGFRNPPGLDDWDLAVAGDSFTELGQLPEEELFTSVLAERLGRRVKNLGVSSTASLSQLEFLRRYGFAASTRDVLVVFFEGNDVHEIEFELRLLTRVGEGGERPTRAFQPQSSLLRALARLLSPGRRFKRTPADVADARFQGGGQGGGGEELLSLHHLPPAREEVSPEARRALERFFDGYAALAEERGVRPRLAYMPAKRRVVHGRVAFTERASDAMRDWTPTDLPELLRELCEAHGVDFLDLSPVLVEASRSHGVLLYNGISDTHLDAEGSRVVGEALAAWLSADG